MKIPASKLKAWGCLFETKKGMRYTITFFADTKQRVIENIKKGKYNCLFKYPETENPQKDKLIFIKRNYNDKLGGYYKGRSVNV